MKREIIWSVSALLAVLSAGATDFYVDNAKGDDANDGRSPAAAFRTIARASQRVGAGDTMHLKSGAPYYEEIRVRGSGTAAKPIRIDGHGAVVSGLLPVPDDSWVEKEKGLFLSTNRICRGACRPRLADREGRCLSVPFKSNPAKFDLATLKPGEAFWNPAGIWYRARPGETPVGKGFRGSYRECGIALSNQHYIDVGNLTCEWASNDGFNVHGTCLGLTFRNIEARFCGDDGFSVHEDVQANVINGHFHHCDDGIADICASQTMYSGCLVESNRLFGVGFSGGLRVLFNSTVRDNDGPQIYVEPSHIGENYRFDKSSPMLRGRAYLKQVRITGGTGPAIRVSGGADVSADRCLLTDNAQAYALVGKGSALYVSTTKIVGLRGEKLVADPETTFVETSVVDAKAP